MTRRRTADDNGPEPGTRRSTRTSNSGNDDGHIDQQINQDANAPSGKKRHGSRRTQGSESGGINGHFDQETTGLANAHGSQHEQQNLGGDKTNLVQTQYDPMWMGSPQGTNPNDKYNIDQHLGSKTGFSSA